jgi:hypothetical protein
MALLPAVVLILGAGVAYATDNDGPDSGTSGGHGDKGARHADSDEPGARHADKGERHADADERGENEDADEPGDVDGPRGTEGTGQPTCEPTTEPTSGLTTEPTGGPTTEPTSELTTEPTCEPTLTGEPVSYAGSFNLLAPGVALLVGSGVLTYAMLRRRP